MSVVPVPVEDAGTITIASIAARAGVSVPTVSKVLNGRADVADTTRDRVEAIIRESGYRRPGGATPAPLLELTFHEFHGPFAIEIIQGVEQVARRHRLGVVVSEFQGRHSPDHTWLKDVLDRRPTGVISVLSDTDSAHLTQLTARGVPIVLVDPTGDPSGQTPAVGATNYSGGLCATRHLLGLGHRRIGMIGGPEPVPCSRARLSGYRSALEEAGIAADPGLVRHGGFVVQDGRAHAADLLRLPDPPTAVFAGNDLQALGVYQAARTLGLSVPRDLSVVGFDDLPLASWSDPPLTTVRQPLSAMAVLATTMLIDLTAGITPTPHRTELATTLVVRESTAPPRTSPRRRQRCRAAQG